MESLDCFFGMFYFYFVFFSWVGVGISEVVVSYVDYCKGDSNVEYSDLLGW